MTVSTVSTVSLAAFGHVRDGVLGDGRETVGRFWETVGRSARGAYRLPSGPYRLPTVSAPVLLRRDWETFETVETVGFATL